MAANPLFRADPLAFIDVGVEARLDPGVFRLEDTTTFFRLDAAAEEDAAQVLSRLSGEVDAGDVNSSALSHSDIAESILSCSEAAAFSSSGASLDPGDSLVEFAFGFCTKPTKVCAKG